MTGIAESVADAHNTLLCAPSLSGDERAVCSDLLLPADPGDVSVLWVSYRRDPAACVEQWRDVADGEPRNAAVLTVGESAGGQAPAFGEVETVPNASDLTGLGIEIGQFLSAWGGELVVCFDSLTALLQYVDLQTAYEFLHAVTGQLYAAGARAHFHVDPTAHDEQTVEAIAGLFDAVVRLGDGADPTVRTRNVVG